MCDRSGPAARLRERDAAPAALGELPLLEQAILATLAYHDLLEMPLTAVEVWRFLIRPRGETLDPPSLATVEGSLRALAARRALVFRSGYYAAPGREHLVARRLDRHARAQWKWKRLRRVAWWLQGIPFLRMVAGSGSLAREHVREASDLDVLIVTAHGRIWTVRFLVTVLLDLFRARRRPTGPTSDRVCLNQYLALDRLRLPYESLYTALEYARLVPLVGERVCWAFRAANRAWMERCLVRVLPDVAPHGKRIPPSPALARVRRVGEWALGGRLGARVERFLEGIQVRRIRRGDPAGVARGRVVARADHLEFHPHSPEAPQIEAFNARMAAWGLSAFGGQRDSGLRAVAPLPPPSA